MKTSLRLRSLNWVPAAFCALLSIMKVIGRDDVTFYCWLPVCFFFAGAFHLELLKRIETLESALADCKEQKAKPTDA